MHALLAEAESTVSATLFYWVVAGMAVAIVGLCGFVVKLVAQNRTDLLLIVPLAESCRNVLAAKRDAVP